jgi:flavin reductase (DIM6/NTAB) family NADH-FMN oxidoreductase RutF
LEGIKYKLIKLNMMFLQKSDILGLEQRYRATFINSLAGFRQAVLIGTKSLEGYENLAIFNSLLHIGAHPPLNGIIFRPDTVQRDTLKNILETGHYTINYIHKSDFEKAHQTAAKYETNVSEFEKTGFTPIYIPEFNAPFVKEAVVKIGMKMEEKIDIKINGTIMIVGSIQTIELNEKIVHNDGFVALEQENVLACTGLDAYYAMTFLGRMKYAKVDKAPEQIIM